MAQKIIQVSVYTLYRLFVLAIRPVLIRTGQVNDQHTIVISNHVHALDPFLITGQFGFKDFRSILPIRTMTSNKFLYGVPYGHFLRLIGCFPAKPHKQHLHGLEAARYYSRSSSIMIFPEGKVRSSNRLHTGAAVLANETNMLITPIFIYRRNKSIFKAFTVVRGEQFRAEGMTIEQMMDKVWELEKQLQ